MLSVREVIKGTEFPKNPFPRILRSLQQSLWYNVSTSDIAKRKDVAVENFVDTIGIGYNIFTTKRSVGVFGYKYFLSKLNLDNVLFLKKYYADLLFKKYERRGDYDVADEPDKDLH